ncbi:ATP-dependent Clp protease proteolytic subunit [Spirillospora sp. NPDC050679]
MTDPRPRAEGRPGPPSFAERTSYGVRETSPYSKLFEERIVFLGTPVDDAAANDVTAQLLALEGADPDRPVSLYINSPGGSLTATAAILDTMGYIGPEVETVCVGQAGSAAAILLAAGSRGRRAALANARVLLREPEAGLSQGSSSDLEIRAAEILRLRERMERVLAEATGRDAASVRADLDRARFLSAAEAADYGLIDTVLTTRTGTAR